MAGFMRAAIVADDDEQFDTQAFARLTAWGASAFICLVLLVLAMRTDLGGKRISAALIAIASPPGESESIANGQLLARTANAEREARRAAETAIALSADRERMATRVSAMEHDVGDLTGSVRRALAVVAESKNSSSFPSMTSAALLVQPKSPTLPGWAPPADEMATYPPPVPTPVVTVTARAPERPAEPQPVATLSNLPLPRPAPLATAPAAPPPAPTAMVRDEVAPSTPKADAAAPALKQEKQDDAATLSTASVNTTDPPIKAELGADLGPALTMGRLRSRWTKLSAERPDLVKGMRPLVMVRDVAPGKPVEIRLLVGPIANVNAAAEFCAILAPAQYLCRPSVFDGQRLTVQ